MIILSLTKVLITGVVVFLLITLLLVGILLYVKKKLTPTGTVKVSINDGFKVIETEPGNTLLSTLGNSKVFLPSACGGGGTCGMCRCQVSSGAGSILPTETGFFTRKEQADHWRLACQVKVKEDIEMHMHQEILGIKKWECTVVSNNNVATYIKEFVVRLPEGETLDFKSGGYIQIDVPKCEVDFKEFEITATCTRPTACTSSSCPSITGSCRRCCTSSRCSCSPTTRRWCAAPTSTSRATWRNR